MKSRAFHIGPSLRAGGVELGGFAYPALWDPTSLQSHMVVKAQTLLMQLNAAHIRCDEPHIVLFGAITTIGKQRVSFSEPFIQLGP